MEEKLSYRGKLIRDMVAEFNKNEGLREKFAAGGSAHIQEKPFKYPDFFELEVIEMENFKMEYLKRKDMEAKLAIMQLHGGGYVGGFKNSYRNFAGLYSEVGNGAAVLSIDYRLAPENPYPAALEDALAGYEWLLSQGFSEENIIFAGDSAGGGLAMGLCHYLKDNGRKLPRAIIAMSPWTDLTASGDSYKENVDIDPVFGSRPDVIYDSTYIGDDDPQNPYISPLFGDFSDFPPMLIQVGTHEMLLSDSLSVANKAKAAGVKVRLTKYEGMFHVFQMAAKLMPESKKAWIEIKMFIEGLIN